MSDVATYFEKKIPERIAANVDGAKSIGAVYLFKINGEGGGVWTLNLKDELGVKSGEHGPVDCTLEMSTESWTQVTKNPGAAMQLFFQGKLKVAGNMMLATKLQQIL